MIFLDDVRASFGALPGSSLTVMSPPTTSSNSDFGVGESTPLFSGVETPEFVVRLARRWPFMVERSYPLSLVSPVSRCRDEPRKPFCVKPSSSNVMSFTSSANGVAFSSSILIAMTTTKSLLSVNDEEVGEYGEVK